MTMFHFNFWASLLAATSAFVLGGLWYSPRLFGTLWCKEAGMLDKVNGQKGHPAKVFILSFILAFIAAAAMAILLQRNPGFKIALHAGFLIGLCWVATSFGINYLFANRSLKLFLIDAGYHILQFTLYGAIIGWLQK